MLVKNIFLDNPEKIDNFVPIVEVGFAAGSLTLTNWTQFKIGPSNKQLIIVTFSNSEKFLSNKQYISKFQEKLAEHWLSEKLAPFIRILPGSGEPKQG